MWLHSFKIEAALENLIKRIYTHILPISVFFLAVVASILITTSAHAINDVPNCDDLNASLL